MGRNGDFRPRLSRARLNNSLLHSCYGPPPPTPESEAACHDQEAVDSLVNRLGKAKQAYDKDLINISEYNSVRKVFVTELNHILAQRQKIEKCMIQGLKIVFILYDKDNINITEWNNLRGTLWNNMHNFLIADANTQDEIEGTLTLIKNLYDQGVINITDFNRTRNALSNKIVEGIKLN